MNPAIRTVSENDDVHVIEGLIAFGGPFNGRDSYRTFASPRTDFHWGMFPDTVPTETGTRDAAEPRFIRPTNYQHGFDAELGMERVGGWSPMRAFDKGIWVQSQLDKHNAYYEAIRELLDKDALAFSAESMEHAVRIDERTGEWLDWPMVAIALTPTPSNPFSFIASRADSVDRVIRVVQALRATDKAGEAEGPPEGGKPRDEIPAEDFAGPDKSFPIVDQSSVDGAKRLIGKADDPEAVKAKVIAIAKRKGLKVPDGWTEDGARSAAIRGAGSDAGQAASAMQSILWLRDCEQGEDDQVAMLDRAVAALQEFITSELAEPAPDVEMMGAYMSAVRAGRRNSTSDQAHIDAIHQHATALGATAHMADSDEADDATPESEPSEAARSGDAVPTLRIVEPADPDAERRRIAALIDEVGQSAFRAFTG